MAWIVGGTMKVELNHDGFREILESDEVRSLVMGAAEEIRARCGDGYESEAFHAGFGEGRWAAVVRAATYEARADESENKTIEKAVNG